MNAFENLLNVPNQQEIDLEYLKKSRLPLVCYGAGVYAYSVKQLLDENNIKIKCFIVDEKYYCKEQTFYGLPIETLSMVLQTNKKVDIVLAFSEYYNKMLFLTKFRQINKCIFLLVNSLFKNFFFDKHFVTQNKNDFMNLYNELSDDKSKQVLISYLQARLSRDCSYLHNVRVENEKPYFPSFLCLAEEESFVDCGAFDGDTIRDFMNETKGKFKAIYAFECDRNNFEKLQNAIPNIPNIYLMEKGVFSRHATLKFFANGTPMSEIKEEGNVIIETETIDNVLQENSCTFIKMDIEGTELEALKGAEKTIRKHKPKLAICVYHKKEDLITIPRYIKSLNNEYEFYLRHYTDVYYDTVLFAIHKGGGVIFLYTAYCIFVVKQLQNTSRNWLLQFSINKRMLNNLKFHHIGYAVRDIAITAEYYLNADWQISNVQIDKIQNTKIAFLSKAEMPLIELIAPIDETSPVVKILNKVGVSTYHVCYETTDIRQTVTELRKQKYIPLFNPVEAVALNNCKICYLYNKNVGLIEIVEIK